MPSFVLIHSPVVGPLTWTLVADELRAGGIEAVVPSLLGEDAPAPPYWEQHVAAVIRSLGSVPAAEPLVFVGHSGAGTLLPAISERAGRPVASYLFVDAVIPERDGMSRLDLANSPEEAERFREGAGGGFISDIWRNEAVLRAVGMEDADLRRRFVQEVPQVPLAVYEEPLPLFLGWPDAPCAYLGFSRSAANYRRSIDLARLEGWPFVQLEGGHFHMLADPPAVAESLIGLLERVGVVVRKERR